MATVGKLCNRFNVCKVSFSRLTNFRTDGISLRCNLKTRQFHSSAALLATIKLDMPSLSPTMEKGNIIKWHKKEGDVISPGDALCDIETDKAILSLDTEETGILAKILTPDNTKDVRVGSLIALLVEEGEDWKSVEIPADVAPKASTPASPVEQTLAPPLSVPAPSASPGHLPVEQGHLIGPSVKKLLQEYNIPSSSVKPSGPGGALLKGDVLDYIESKGLKKVTQEASPVKSEAPAKSVPPKTSEKPLSAPGSKFVDIPLTNMRRVIAKRLTESKTTIPHAYASIDSNMGPLSHLRKILLDDGVKVSVNDFIIKAAAFALQRVPKVNAIWANDGPRLSSTVDISVAVATPNGLITPIVKGASYLSVDQIGSIVKELSGRAREGKLLPHEYQGGSFSISNLGMFGITEFSAVINPPQLAILAVGSSRYEASVKGNQLKMNVTLSYDSRAVNEVEAARFLEEFRNVIENPQSMLSGTNLDSAAEAFVF